MELRLLRYFVAVAEELHFGRAAQRLFIAQPSLSNQIRKLEHQLDVRLFTRDRHRVELTAAGRALLDPARGVLAAADELPAVARAASGAGRLTVGYVPYARNGVLPELLDAFRRVRPGADVAVRSAAASPEVFGDLRAGRIDAGILRAPVSAPWLGQLTLTVEPFHVALPVTHPLATRPRVRLADLAPETFALFPRELNPPAHDHLMGFFALAGFTPSIGHRSRRMDESLFFVASGAGVGLFPRSVTQAMTEPRIAFREVVDPTPTVEIVLGWNVNSTVSLVPELVEVARGVATRRPVPG